MGVVHNDEYYYQNIRNYLILRAHAVRVDAKLNLLNLAGMSEDFYCKFLNILLDCHFENANASERNKAGIDLIDWKKQITAQISVTCAPKTIREKIRGSIWKFDKPEGNWQFYFVPITDQAPDLQKNFDLPAGLTFDKDQDVLDIARIMEIAKSKDIDKLRELSLLVDKYSSEEQRRVEQHHSNLREKLDKLLLETWKHHRSFKLMQTDEIDRRLFPGIQDSHQFEALGKRKDDETDSPVWSIIRESWKEQENHPVMIEGGGGIGKTVTLFSLTNMDKDTIPAPAVYVPMFELIDQDKKIVDLSDYFKSSHSLSPLNAEERKELCSLAEKFWDNGPSLLLLLDGFNEVPGACRWDVLKMLRDWHKANPGAQLIAVSRPIDNLNLKTAFGEETISVILSALTKESVTAYLKSLQRESVHVPDSNALVWGTIAYPLFLNLYVKTDRLRNQQAWKDYPLDVREADGPGSIIWNFLQRELLRHEDESWILRCAVASEYLAPILANHMMQRYDYTISQKEAVEVIKKAAAEMDLDRMPAHLTELLSWWETQELSATPPQFLKDLNWPDIVLRESGLLVPYREQHIGIARQKIETQFEFLHQNFRDCLAGLYLVNQAEMTEDDKLPETWQQSQNHLALGYTAELVNPELFNSLWEANRRAMQYTDTDAKRSHIATCNLLELSKRNNALKKHLDFSGMDLRKLSLVRYFGKSEPVLPLFQNRTKTRRTVLNRSVFESDGHSNSIRVLAVLPDRRIISGSEDGTLRVWDATTGQCLQILEGHTGSITCMGQLSGGCVVSGSVDTTLRVWDTATGQCLQTLVGHTSQVTCLAVFPDGRVVSGSYDTTLRVWNTATGECLRILENPWNMITCVALLPDGGVVNGSVSCTLRVWDISTGQCLKVLEGHTGTITCLTVLSNGCVVSGSVDTTLRVWDATAGLCLQNMEGHTGQVTCMVELPDRHVVSGSDDHTLRVWDVASGNCLQILKEHTSSVRCVVVLSNGHVVSGSDDHTLRVWDVAEGLCLQNMEGHLLDVSCVTAHPDGRVISGSRDASLRVWDAKTGQCLQMLKRHTDSANCITALSDGRVVCGAWVGTLRVWDSVSCKIQLRLEGHAQSVTCVAALSDGRVVSGSFDNTLRVWTVSTGKCLKVLEGHTGPVTCVAALPDGRVVSGAEDHTLRVWDTKTGRCLQTLEMGCKHAHVYCVAVLPDGRVVSGSVDTSLRVWDVSSGQCLQIIEGNGAWLNCATVLSNDCVICGSSFFNSLVVFDIAKGKRLYDIELSGMPYCLATLSEKNVVSGSSNGNLQVWDVTTGQCLQTMRGHTDIVSCVSVFPDGRVISGSYDGTLRIWDATTGKCLDILEATEVDVSKMDFSDASLVGNLPKLLWQNGAKISSEDYERWVKSSPLENC